MEKRDPPHTLLLELQKLLFTKQRYKISREGYWENTVQISGTVMLKAVQQRTCNRLSRDKLDLTISPTPMQHKVICRIHYMEVRASIIGRSGSRHFAFLNVARSIVGYTFDGKVEIRTLTVSQMLCSAPSHRLHRATDSSSFRTVSLYMNMSWYY